MSETVPFYLIYSFELASLGDAIVSVAVIESIHAYTKVCYRRNRNLYLGTFQTRAFL